MRRGLLASCFVLALLLISLPPVSSFHQNAAPVAAGNAGAQAAGKSPSPNAVVITTSTTTVTTTRTVNITIMPPGPKLAIHVVNQFGIWYQGAVVEVYQQLSSSSYNLVANGTTVNGVFYAAGLVNYSTYMVNVYTPTGGSGSQTVTVTEAGASLTFVIAAPVPPAMSLLNVSVSPSALGGGFSLNASLTNTSNSTAYNAQLTVQPPPQLALLNTGSVIPIGTLAPGQSKPIALQMTVSSAAATVAYTL